MQASPATAYGINTNSNPRRRNTKRDRGKNKSPFMPLTQLRLTDGGEKNNKTMREKGVKATTSSGNRKTNMENSKQKGHVYLRAFAWNQAFRQSKCLEAFTCDQQQTNHMTKCKGENTELCDKTVVSWLNKAQQGRQGVFCGRPKVSCISHGWLTWLWTRSCATISMQTFNAGNEGRCGKKCSFLKLVFTKISLLLETHHCFYKIKKAQLSLRSMKTSPRFGKQTTPYNGSAYVEGEGGVHRDFKMSRLWPSMSLEWKRGNS